MEGHGQEMSRIGLITDILLALAFLALAIRMVTK